jgi:HAD domain in Swiss Army Knife RNA repair proteins
MSDPLTLSQHNSANSKLGPALFDNPAECDVQELQVQPTFSQRSASAAVESGVFLALDFDGVLHHRGIKLYRNDDFAGMAGSRIRQIIQQRFPVTVIDPEFDATGALFDREHHLCRVLNECANARIIISSSWRHNLTNAQLQQVLSAQVAARIAGVLTRDKHDGLEPGDRARHVERWLTEHGFPDAHWIALDDDPLHYISHQHKLVRTHFAGLDAATAQKAIALLNAPSRRRRAGLARPCTTPQTPAHGRI